MKDGMDGARILITGGAGFIGSNLANALAETNDVHVIDDCSLGTPENLTEDVRFTEQSVLEDELPTAVDVIFHLAARSSYAMHEANPQAGTRVNVEGFVNVVEQARKSGCENIVYASTSSLYDSCTKQTPESEEVCVSTAYEASKRAREAYAESFATQYGLSLTGLRYFSVYQGYETAENHKGEYANVISQFAADIARGESPTLYGDGTQTRDFTHISDVVRATVLAAEHELDGVYNVGTGTRHSFNTVVDRINAELGTDVMPTYVPNPIDSAVYVHDTCADYTKLREATGWEPRVPFDEGVKRVCSPYPADCPNTE